MQSLSFDNRIDQLNVALIVISWALAMFLPFETLLLAYAFLGPAHYLTQISWMHDRQYFTAYKLDYLPIIALSILIFAFLPYYMPIMMLMISYAVSVAYFKDWKKRLISMGIITAVMGTAHYFSFGVGFYLIVTTFLHVGIFTSMFMLSGALKTKSFYGFLGVFLLYLGGALALTLPLIDYQPSAYAEGNIKYMADILISFASVFHFEYSYENVEIVGRFAGFLYLYHYLNWFSKTRIIGWHEISKQRLQAIIALYCASVFIYLLNYELGFKVLLFLSFLHVALEFPLNAHSAKDIIRYTVWRKKAA